MHLDKVTKLRITDLWPTVPPSQSVYRRRVSALGIPGFRFANPGYSLR
jgi:hypothetical protein